MLKGKLEVGQFVVYPAHGVGLVKAYESHEIAGQVVEMIVVAFDKERLVLRVPVNKIKEVGIRKLSSKKTIKQALDVLKVPIKKKKLMWSRRAQEYENKINSGDILAIAEVVRALYKDSDKVAQSYSERQIYTEAFNRLLNEFMTVENLEMSDANERLEKLLTSVA